jgi:UDP-GlcNAc:undecaprenyl-phosphate GlcNAc-1-phosphate transferase
MTPSLWVQLGLFFSGLLLSVAITTALTLLVRQLACRYGLVDSPNARSLHKHPIPRVGGMAIVGGVASGLLFFAILGTAYPELKRIIDLPEKWILMGAVAMFALGLYDDLRGIGAFPKLAVESAVALSIIGAGYRFDIPFFQSGAMAPLAQSISVLITFLWIIGIVNAVNLIDGVDGLAAGVGVTAICSLIIALAMAGEGPDLALATAFIGALIGFLIFNFHPASIFMGDSGSLFLGFILATFALPASGLTSDGWAILIPVLALGLPVLDTLTAIGRRAIRHRNIFHADKDHIHHRLLAHMGQAQRSAVCLLYAMNALFGMLAILVLAIQSVAIVAILLSTGGIAVLIFLNRLGYLQIRDTQNQPRDMEPVSVKCPFPLNSSQKDE